jgi:hypothetical protein
MRIERGQIPRSYPQTNHMQSNQLNALNTEYLGIVNSIEVGEKNGGEGGI